MRWYEAFQNIARRAQEKKVMHDFDQRVTKNIGERRYADERKSFIPSSHSPTIIQYPSRTVVRNNVMGRNGEQEHTSLR
jgi:hypothetical protein